MITEIFKAFDALIKVLNIYVETDRQLFQTHIDPLYKDIASIQKDYLKALSDMSRIAVSKEDLSDKKCKLHNMVAERVHEFDTIRQQCNGITNSYINSQTRNFPPEALDFFTQCAAYLQVRSGDDYFRGHELEKYLERAVNGG